MLDLVSNFLKIFESLQQEKAHEILKIFFNALNQLLYSATKNYEKREPEQLKFSYSWVFLSVIFLYIFLSFILRRFSSIRTCTAMATNRSYIKKHKMLIKRH